MDFAAVSGAFEKMEGTSKRLELTDVLVELFSSASADVLPKIVYLIQGKLRPDYEGIELGIAEKLAMRAMSKSSGIPIRQVQEAMAKDGDLGHAARSIMSQKVQTTFAGQSITVERVYDTLYKIAQLGGSGSQDIKIRHISSLLNDASPDESSFILKLLLGTLRLGIAENTAMDALAAAFAGGKENKPRLEQAYNVCPDLGKIASAVAEGGLEALEEFKVGVHMPVRPMLAERVRSEADAVEKMGTGFAAEFKLDGERVQVHIAGTGVRVFSRSLEDITNYYPDITEKIPGMLRCKEAILEAEAVAINPDTGAFLPFQELMHRRRKHGIKSAVSKYPISVNFFDILYADKKSLLASPYSERRKALEGTVKSCEFARCVPASRIEGQQDIVDAMENSINSGCEGLMLKMQGSPYQAGSRGSHWLKLKREYQNDLADSLDLVVIGAYFGKGRRTGKYGTLLLASYNDESDAFESICKVGTGFSDAQLDQMYQVLSHKVCLKKDQRVDSDMEADVWFAPEMVIEVAASEITLSPVHKSAYGMIKKGAGLALRFPKYTGRTRLDKMPEDASTGEEVVALYKSQSKTSEA